MYRKELGTGSRRTYVSNKNQGLGRGDGTQVDKLEKQALKRTTTIEQEALKS
jgi:hypothetical protein